MRTNLVSVLLQALHGLAVEVLDVGGLLQKFEKRVQSLLILHEERRVVLEPSGKVGFDLGVLSKSKLDLDDALERFETPEIMSYTVSFRNMALLQGKYDCCKAKRVHF